MWNRIGSAVGIFFFALILLFFLFFSFHEYAGI